MKTAGNIILKIFFIIVLLSRSIFATMAQDELQTVSQPAKKDIPRITFKNLSPPYIRQLDGKGCKIWMTGHSLGAALATLSAGRYGNVQGVYTFGSPRVGNEVFKEKLDVTIYRIVNNDDIVARVPAKGVYVHVGELKFIDSDGTIRDHMIVKERPVEKRLDETYGQENTNPQKKNSFAGFVPAAFRDHVPLLYAVYLWNNIIEKQN